MVALVRDLMTASRIESLVAASRATLTRVDAVSDLPAPDVVDLLVVDWADRGADWGQRLANWRAADGSRPRVVLFGPHADLAAHAAAREAGLGPMRARSAFFAVLPDLIAGVRRPD